MIDTTLLEELRPLGERFAAAGHRLYLVGGVVRDQLLGRPLAVGDDVDLTTDARPPAIKRLVSELASAVWTQGERFGTIGCRIEGRDYEITTHRGEVYHPDSRKPHVEYADDVEHDLSRRDFTVNAMAAVVPTGELIDPFGGVTDLDAHRLRTPLAPEESFSDDPLRMLRAARFIAGYELVPVPGLASAVRALAGRITIVSVERCRVELDKLLVLPQPEPGLRFLVETGVLARVVPGGPTATPAAVEAAIARVAGVPPRLALRLAAFLHDPAHPHRAEVRSALRRLRHSNEDTRAVLQLVDAWQVAVDHDGPWRAADVRRLAHLAGAALDDVIALARVQHAATGLEAAVAAAREADDLDDLEPELDGGAVMAALGLNEGPEVGAALAFLGDLRLTEGRLGAEEATRRLKAWWADRIRRSRSGRD
jgi:poly(A) polymerase